MHVAIAGAGAIGGFLAGALAKSGARVSIVARGEHLRRIQADGLTVRSSRLGDFTVQLEAAADLRELERPEVVFTTFKAHQWPSFIPQFAGYRNTATSVMTFQNGLPFWYFEDRNLHSVDPTGEIRGLFDRRQLVGGVVHSSARVAEPGVVEQSGDVHYPIGELDGSASERITALSATFAGAGLNAPIQSNIRKAIWLKLLGNVSLNPISALTGARVSAMLADEQTRDTIAALMRETLQVAAATGVDLGVSAEQRIEMARETVADVKTSMLQDLEAGRPLEIEPIAGAVVELADAYGIDIPHVRMAYALVKRLDATRRC
jgi:2-dehydropantoate 2-reductase